MGIEREGLSVSGSELQKVVGGFLVSPQEIVEYFSRVQSKDDVVCGFLRYGQHCFANLALFSVFPPKEVQFLKGVGENIKDSPHLGIVSVDRNTILRRVIINKFPYRGPIPVGGDEKMIFSKFFDCYAEEVFIYPGCIRDSEVDVIFYADDFCGTREICLNTFEYIVEKSILAFKYLWVQKQLTSV